MQKYLYGLIALILLSLVVTSQYEYYAHKNAPICKANGSLAVSVDDGGQAKCDTENAKRNSPGWYVAYVVFGWPTGITVWALVLTMIVVAEQASLTRQAIIASDASSMTELRAYLGVIPGTAMYQERTKAFRFGVIPTLANSGKTPAYDVRWIIKSDVLPFPLPQGHVLSEVGEESGETILGISQSLNMHTLVPHFIADNEVDNVKANSHGQALYTWGIVTYRDAFKRKHFTRFCQRVMWLEADKTYFYYEPDRNNAD